jgi:tricorn protease
LLLASPLGAEEPPAGEVMRLVEGPALSPDGTELAFAWRGDVWLAASTGGPARRLTAHPANDRGPRFAPDGRRLAFTSNRTGADQVFVLDLSGGEPVQVTRHSEGSVCQGWFPDGKELLVAGRRDHDHDRPERFLRVEARPGAKERLLFDDWGYDGTLSPDGTRLAFVRQGTGWSRKGYRGSQAAQVWVHALGTERFDRVSKGPHEERWPLWAPDGASLRLVSGEDGTRNLISVDLAHGSRACLTSFVDDGVTFPTCSADGRVFVFRVLADLYRFEPGTPPRRLELRALGEPSAEALRREELTKASEVAFSGDGREVAFCAGGDIWVMDTELREPRRVTDTPEEEREPLFSHDFQTLFYVSDRDGRTDLWRAERKDCACWWWQNETFTHARITDDVAAEGMPRLTPDGATLLYTRSPGTLWKRPVAEGEPTQVVDGWDAPAYVVSPDGRWVAYAQADDDFNHEIWIAPLDGSRPPFNLSVHPDNEHWPAWSPDGRMLAFVGRRWDRESDICYVWLRREDDEKDARERKLEKAVERMKGRKGGKTEPAKPAEPKPAPGTPTPDPEHSNEEPPPAEPSGPKDEAKPATKERPPAKEGPKPPEVRIDFEGLTDRIRRISIPDAQETDLLWSPDSKRLAFRATIKGQAGWHAVEIPDELAPKLLSATALQDTRWIKEGDLLLGHVDGVPTTLTGAGKVTSLPFRVRRRLDVGAFHKALFERAWLVMRDTWYDPRLNHRDPEALRAKYAPIAEATRTPAELDVVLDLFLGELNGSHLGFTMLAGTWSLSGWRETTGHLGARLLPPDGTPGRVVRDVVRGTPAYEASTRLEPGERVLAVDGVTLAPDTDLDGLLTGDPEREVELRVADASGKERTLRLRPTSYAAVRAGLYEEGLAASRARVDSLSGGRLGYLHVRAMNQASFERFEEDLYKVGHGKDGLLIDVRGNGGGFTADHLLTCLTQPRHATTVPRNGGPGYPHDRIVFAPWQKPVVVLIDQDSFSNAEIFAHAMRTLKRARLVGVPTAGGVISTGGTTLMGAATLRLPFRGWFLPNGDDMERNGCPPDVEVWPLPTELPRGIDRQLDQAVTLLQEDVRAWQARPTAPPRYASERDGLPPGAAPRR